MPERIPPADRAQVLRNLEVIDAELTDLEERREFLYDERTRVFHEGQALPRAERPTQAAMAKAAGVSGTSVINCLKRDPKQAPPAEEYRAPARPRRRRTPEPADA